MGQHGLTRCTSLLELTALRQCCCALPQMRDWGENVTGPGVTCQMLVACGSSARKGHIMAALHNLRSPDNL